MARGGDGVRKVEREGVLNRGVSGGGMLRRGSEGVGEVRGRAVRVGRGLGGREPARENGEARGWEEAGGSWEGIDQSF